MNVVDSSGWLEFFAAGPNAQVFAPVIQHTSTLIVPTLSICEVFKRVLVQRGEAAALQVSATMQMARVVDLSAEIARSAAVLGVRHKLALADSIMFASAVACGATLWTQDADFDGIPGVRFVRKK